MTSKSYDEQLSAVLQELELTLSKASSMPALYEAIVNAPFDHQLFTTSLDLGIIVLLRTNKDDEMIDRIALSRTSLANGAVRASAKPFHEIRIPVHEEENIISRAIREQTSFATEDWHYLFTPALTDQQARRNQMGASIECSIVYPLQSSPEGAMIFSFFQPERNLDTQHNKFLVSYTELVSKYLRRFS